jgi:hypothetical protein
MNEALWTLPQPSSALLHGGAFFEVLLGRRCQLWMAFEAEDGEEERFQLILSGVEAYKCTYLYGCTREQVAGAYDRLIDRGRSEWLEATAAAVRDRGLMTEADRLKHLVIYFDDGPCYEFLCSSFEVNSDFGDTLHS